MLVAFWLAIRAWIRIATRLARARLVGLRAILMLVAFWLAIRARLSITSGLAGARLVGLWAILVLVTYRLAVSFRTVGVATRCPGTGLVRLRTVSMLITYGLTVSGGAVRVAARASRARLVGLRAVSMLITYGLAVSSETVRVAARHRENRRLGRRFRWSVFGVPPAEGLRILEASLNLLTRPIEQLVRLAQRLLSRLSHAGLNLVQHLLLVLDYVLGLGQEAEHIILGQLGTQAKGLIQVGLKPKGSRLIRHFVRKSHAFHLLHAYLGQRHVQGSLFGRVRCRV